MNWSHKQRSRHTVSESSSEQNEVNQRAINNNQDHKGELRNLVSQEELKRRIQADCQPRTTLSFYQYHPIENPQAWRDELFVRFTELGVLGRVYVAHEGINAQISVPTEQFGTFKSYLYGFDFLDGLRLNIAREDDGKSFYVLKIKVRPKIVADGIEDPDFSMENRGAYLQADEFNQLTAQPETIVVDMRNYYEYEVGHFQNALEVPSDTFREQLPLAVEMLQKDKEKPIVMYCTGGIRCEKASAYLKHHGFQNVYHLEGGIIEYARQVQEQGLENKFKGKNFVFDSRLAENISGEIISHCHQCGELCDTHHNCDNAACHLLFLQCEACREKYEGCCSEACRDAKNLSPEEQKTLNVAGARRDEWFNNSRHRRTRAFDVHE